MCSSGWTVSPVWARSPLSFRLNSSSKTRCHVAGWCRGSFRTDSGASGSHSIGKYEIQATLRRGRSQVENEFIFNQLGLRSVKGAIGRANLKSQGETTSSRQATTKYTKYTKGNFFVYLVYFVVKESGLGWGDLSLSWNLKIRI
jgi:hypothetical protein